MKYATSININKREISINSPTYFIADIASNHDGCLERAKELIWLAKESGADAVKFQHFLADKIVSDYGFKHLGRQVGHQSSWKKSVYEIYKECEYNRQWNEELAQTAVKADIEFFTTPYDVEAVEEIDKYVSAYKVGSGDITWIDFIQHVAGKNKPVLLATGASDMEDVRRAVEAIIGLNKEIVLMQCNTNYTGSLENLKSVNLAVLKTYANMYPQMLLGLSDHTPGHATVLGAIALGARVVEKHFTSDNNRIGPDHAFSMNPQSWREMVEYSRELEAALGDGYKKVEANENDTVIVQQRCIRTKRDIAAGEILAEDAIEVLRPAPEGAYRPYQKELVLGRRVKISLHRGEAIYPESLE